MNVHSLAPLRLCVSLLGILPGLLVAANPAWWDAPETQIIDPQAAEDNKAPVLVGQLKHMAMQAKKHLDANGGAGTAVDAMIDSFGMDSDANHAPLLLGQLKHVASPFYARLQEIGYDTNANLIARGYPSSWAYDTPWGDPQASNAGNKSPAVIGQLKMVFSFDLSGYQPPDTDGEGLPDWWQMQHFGQLGNDPNALSGDGQTLLQEYQNGTDPHKLDHPLVNLEVNVIVR